MKNLEKILFPTDHSDHSNQAIEYAIALARAFKAKMYILHVVELFTKDPANPMFHKPNLEDYTDIRDFVKTSTKKQVGSSRVDTDKLEYEEINVMGLSAGRKIAEIAEEKSVDLIVMASNGAGFLEHLLLGSTTELVVKEAGCPVLVINRGDRDFVDFESDTVRLKTILCPVDFSDYSARTLEAAASFAQKFNAKLVILHVIEEMFETMDFLLDHFTVDEFEEKREEIAEKRIKEFAKKYVPENIPREVVLLHGNPKKKIDDYAKEKKIDLITIGAFGRGEEDGIIFSGSVTLKVLRHADCPVLVVR